MPVIYISINGDLLIFEIDEFEFNRNCNIFEYKFINFYSDIHDEHMYVRVNN